MEDIPTDELIVLMGEVAQELTRRFEDEKRLLQVPFPRGYIRTLGTLKKRWPYLPNDVQRTLACTLQLCDINKWQLNIWRIGLTAGSVWEWHCTLPVISVMETLSHGFGVHCMGYDTNFQFKKIINKLYNDKVITMELRDELHHLRELRNEVHLFLKGWVEMHDDKPRRYNRAVRTLKRLESELEDHWKNNT